MITKPWNEFHEQDGQINTANTRPEVHPLFEITDGNFFANIPRIFFFFLSVIEKRITFTFQRIKNALLRLQIDFKKLYQITCLQNYNYHGTLHQTGQ